MIGLSSNRNSSGIIQIGSLPASGDDDGDSILSKISDKKGIKLQGFDQIFLFFFVLLFKLWHQFYKDALFFAFLAINF